MFPESKALQKAKVYKLFLLFPSYFSWKGKSFDEFYHLIYREYIRRPYFFNHVLDEYICHP